MITIQGSDYLTYPEMAEVFGFSRKHAYNLAKQGKIDAYRQPKRTLFSRESVERFILGTKVQPIGRPRKGARR